MRHLTILGLLALGLLLLAGPAQADTILNFMGGGNGDLRVGAGDPAYPNVAQDGDIEDWWQVSKDGGIGVDFAIGGHSFTATAWVRDDASDTTPLQIFTYGDTTGSQGGLGAVATGSDFTGQPQDNIWDFQSVQLAFDSRVTIGDGTFFSGRHGTSFDPSTELWIRVDGGAWDVRTLASAIAVNRTGQIFEFFNPNASGSSSDGARFYVSALSVSNPVPEPASIALFSLGAGGLALARRRRRNAV